MILQKLKSLLKILPNKSLYVRFVSVMKTAVKISPVNIEARKALDIRAGDTVRVSQKIQEKGKTRIQMFEGLVLAVKHGKEAGGTFTVRKVASGVGVEKVFPIYSPNIEKIEIVKRSKVRQSKLYHVREKAAKEIRREMRNIRELPDTIDDSAPDLSAEAEPEVAKEAPVEEGTETPAAEENKEVEEKPAETKEEPKAEESSEEKTK